MSYLRKYNGKIKLNYFQVGIGSIILTGLVLPLIIKNNYLIHLVFMSLLFGVLAVSLNFAIGYCGLANLAHGTFFGLGAYVTALLALNFSTPFYVNLILGGLFASIFGILLGIPTLRLKGVFLALVSIGFTQIIRIIQLNWVELTRGPMGLPGIPAAKILNFQFTIVAYCYYILFLLIITLTISWRIKNSKIGRAFFAIKIDPLAASSIGVNIVYYKILAYVISSFIAGSAGSIYAHYVSFISPDTFTLNDSITILSMVILGGAGTIFGPLIGAMFLVLIPELFRFVDLYRMIFIGSFMVVGVILNDGTPGDFLKLKLQNLKQQVSAYFSKGSESL